MSYLAYVRFVAAIAIALIVTDISSASAQAPAPAIAAPSSECTDLKNGSVATPAATLDKLVPAKASRLLIAIGNNYVPPLAPTVIVGSPPLKNAVSDAVAMTKYFGTRGYVTICLLNAPKAAITRVLGKVSERQQDGAFVVFYFAGHGFSADGKTFAVAADTDRSNRKNLLNGSLNTDELAQAVLRPNSRLLIILDSCRSEYQPALDLSGRTLSPVESVKNGFGGAPPATKSILIHFAADEGALANDLPKRGHGLYAEAFLAEAGGYGQAIFNVLDNIAGHAEKGVMIDGIAYSQSPQIGQIRGAWSTFELFPAPVQSQAPVAFIVSMITRFLDKEQSAQAPSCNLAESFSRMLWDYVNQSPDRKDLQALQARLDASLKKYCTAPKPTDFASIESAIGLIAFKTTAATKTLGDAMGKSRLNLPVSTKVWMAPQSFEYQLDRAKTGDLKQFGSSQAVNSEFFAVESGGLVRALARGKIEVADSSDQIVLDFDDSGFDLTADSRSRLNEFLQDFSPTQFSAEDWVVLLPPQLQGPKALAADRRLGAIRAQTISLAVAERKLPVGSIILPDLAEPAVLESESVQASQVVLKRTSKHLVAVAHAPIDAASLPVISNYIFTQ